MSSATSYLGRAAHGCNLLSVLFKRTGFQLQKHEHIALPIYGALLRRLSSLPPHTVPNMPALSPTMFQGNMAKWHVKPGDEVKPGTVLADVETDKATLAFENQDEGFVAKLLVPDDARDIPVGRPIAVLVEDSGSVGAFAGYSVAQAAGVPSSALATDAHATAPQRGGPPKGYPPYTRMIMPALSPTMERGNIVSWKVAVGDSLKPGDVLAEIETDKATLAFENVSDEGYIARILVPSGSRDVAVGVPVALVVERADEVPAFADFGTERSAAAPGGASSATVPVPPADDDVAAAAHPRPSQQLQRVDVNSRMGPAARILLEAAGLSPADVTPTGPNSIVTKSDVLAALGRGWAGRSTTAAAAPAERAQLLGARIASTMPSTPVAAPHASTLGVAAPAQPAAPASASLPLPTGQQLFVDTANSQIRRIIAKRLLDSKVDTPAMYLSAETQLEAIGDLRAALAAKGAKVSVNDCVLRAVALALRDVPAANVAWDEAACTFVPFAGVDISFAVSTEKGLITPIVKAADTKGLQSLSREVRSLAMRARENKLKPEEFMGGSFTVSNLGMYGLSYFSAIINPPQAAILAIGGGRERIVLRGGEPTVTTAVTVTMSADSRVYDGELAGAFLAAFQSHMEKPYELLGSG